MNKKILHIVFGLWTLIVYSQSGLNAFLKPSDSLIKSRRNAVIISETALGTVSLLALNELWYADYPRSNFHTLDDTNEWLQMDKLGHVYSAYQLGRVGADVLNWSGVSEKNQLIYGGTLGFTFLTAVEILDGFSEEWGFSWGDMAANATGTGLFIGQELLWHEQRITMKYSFHRTQYASQRPDKLGDGLAEEFLKDYNGQTYWLSVNIQSFFKKSKIPTWLNVAFGYGADGMLTGQDEPENNLFQNQNRVRQFYLSLDIDLTRIKTNSHVLKTVFALFNTIKVPFPTMEFNEENGISFHGIYF
ncbi:Predicted lipoprotein [Bizionia echini]|uniref:Predicted lipoprotein n=1 Tax=Bizionia echini TaxID=649333 RepID=A0A1I5BW63_9FLAO|nr:Predicted lipoprotein [Bizionia echini]